MRWTGGAFRPAGGAVVAEERSGAAEAKELARVRGSWGVDRGRDGWGVGRVRVGVQLDQMGVLRGAGAGA